MLIKQDFVIRLELLNHIHLNQCVSLYNFFFFNDTATTEIYTLSLHDALPIYQRRVHGREHAVGVFREVLVAGRVEQVDNVIDRKSTRLNSSHLVISYAVFCLKKKKNIAILIRDASNWRSSLRSHSILHFIRSS